MSVLRTKDRHATQCDRDKMLHYLNRFKLKKKQIKYKPRTYANLQGINSLRSQNAINIEAPRPVIKESVKARLDCNLNALLQLDNEKNLNNDNENRRIKPQESFINMELDVVRKDPKQPKQKPQQNEAELESEQDQLSNAVHSEFDLEPMDLDYRSDFEACFENQTESLLNLQRNHRRHDLEESSLPKLLKKQYENNDEFHFITPLPTKEELNSSTRQNRSSEKYFNSSNATEKEIENHIFHDMFERSDDSFEFNRHDGLFLDSKPSFNGQFQSERVKQKQEIQQNDDTFAKQKYRQDEWETSALSTSLNQCSKNQFVFPDRPSKVSSSIHSHNRFNRNHNKKVTNNTRPNSMLDKLFYDKSYEKTSLRSKKSVQKPFNSSFQAKPFERNKNNPIVNPPSIDYSSVGSEYVESWDTIRNGIKAGHRNEPPTLSDIPDKVFFDEPIHYERSPSQCLWNFSGSNVSSALTSFVRSISVPKYAQNARPSVLTACFTRTVIRGQNAYGEIIYHELRKSR